jgi:hypothetical protein
MGSIEQHLQKHLRDVLEPQAGGPRCTHESLKLEESGLDWYILSIPYFHMGLT